ncbi:MAG: phosphoglycerate dehydrogenase [Bacteroidota bacterium]
MKRKKYFIIDFDSTFTKVEALDELCNIALSGRKDRDRIVQQVKEITDRAMDGSLSFSEALKQRVALLDANRTHLPLLVARLKKNVSDSIVRNRAFFEQNGEDVIIMSNGFKDFIVPIVVEYGILERHVYANTFEFNADGDITGFDKENPLAGDNGKVELMRELKLEGDVFVIGDGYTDYQIREAGLADQFYAFTENVNREHVSSKADHVAPSFDEVLYVNKLPMSISYPKNRINVLLLENIHAKGKAFFEREGYQVETISSALDEDELCEAIKDVSILGIRSKTNLTKKVLENANRLLVVGAFCIGTNQIDLEACLQKGITVFNAPYSNTRSVVELAIGEIILLMRNLPDKIRAMHEGKWEKSASGAFEVRGKKLGIVGYGNIGSQLSVLAEGMGMDVYYYDMVERLALGNATKCYSLKELLNTVDVVSLHVDGRPENKVFFGEEEFVQMKDGAYFLNLARGFVVDIPALVGVLKNGKLKGAGIDVFPEEPKNNRDPFISELKTLPNLILTPHIGGSTLEAQENIADFVPSKIIEYVNTGNTFNSVNFPNVQLPILTNAHRLLHIHKNVSGVMAKINAVLASHEINIMGQYLKTNEQIGYVITDIDKKYNRAVIKDLKAIENTIKFRILY